MIITGRTRVFTILAHPSGHVTAPIVYNHLFSALDLDMVYVSHDVTPDALPETIRGFAGWRNLGGFNVTIPHKEASASLADSLCDVSARIGVVNTVVRGDDGTLSGYNTDGIGAMKALGSVRGETCLMVGAGGAARAIVDALLREGAARVLVLNRSQEGASRLCGLFPGLPVGIYSGEHLSGFSIVVQATPVADAIPFGLDLSALPAGSRILETIMRPTALAEAARAQGLELISGHAMLYHQTARNFALLTGIELTGRHLDDAFASVGYQAP